MRVLASAIMFVVMAVGISGQSAQKPKKFLTAPVDHRGPGQLLRRRRQKVTDTRRRRRRRNGSRRAPAADHDRPDVRAVPDSRPRNTAGWPVIMVHGSTHTAACLESTPDGREGWYPYFVRQGVPSYVVDQSGRGRSGFDESVIHEAKPRLVAGEPEAAPTDPRLRPDHRRRRVDQLVRPPRPGGLDDPDRQADPARRPGRSEPAPGRLRARRAAVPDRRGRRQIVSRAGAIGPAPSGAPETFALEYYKQLVPNAEVTLPGSTCNTCDPQELAPANTWTPQNLASLVERLGGAIVVTHSQSGIMGHHMARILKERGHLDLLKGLITLEGACSLPNSGLHRRRLRQHSVPRAQRRLHGDEHGVPGHRRRHQRAARGRSRARRRRST